MTLPQLSLGPNSNFRHQSLLFVDNGHPTHIFFHHHQQQQIDPEGSYNIFVALTLPIFTQKSTTYSPLLRHPLHLFFSYLCNKRTPVPLILLPKLRQNNINALHLSLTLE
jgi:hypothetical protein